MPALGKLHFDLSPVCTHRRIRYFYVHRAVRFGVGSWWIAINGTYTRSHVTNTAQLRLDFTVKTG